LKDAQRKVKKEQMENSFIKSFIENSPYIINVWTSDIRLVQTSQQAVKMFGLKNQQEYLDRFAELSPQCQPCGTSSIEKAVALVKKAFSTGSAQFEWLHQDLNGNLIPTEIFLLRFEDSEGLKVLATTTDLRNIFSAQKKEQEAVASSQIATDANQAKTRFLERMSHEIRTPLNSVLGITETQLQKNHSPEIEKAFLRIHNSSSLLLAIINDILDLGKIESGKKATAFNAYELTSIIVDTLQLHLVCIGDKNIEFKLELDEQLPLRLLGDEVSIKQILNNLLSNAIKYTDSGEIRLSVGIEQKDYDDFSFDDIMLIFTVQDTGQGMTEEEVEALFEEYNRYKTDEAKSIKGTGLGMNIVWQLVNIVGGRIEVKSELGVGSTFSVYIPQIPQGTDVFGKKNIENLQNLENLQNSLRMVNKIKREFMPYGRVLVVDDVESNIEVIKDFLMPYRIDTDTVNCGEAAVRKVKDGNVYDIIFMDHKMPEMDGIEATKIIRELGYEQPIIALTANVFAGVVEMLLSNGFTEYLSKPIDLLRLDAFLNKFIRDKQPKDVLEKANLQMSSENDGDVEKKEENSDIKDRIMNAFLRDAQRSISALELFCDSSEIDDKAMKNFIVHTHSMKSAFNNIERSDLSAVAAELEEAGYENNIKKINEQTPLFLEQLKEIVKENRPK
jgi:signal transduction histidine kinase/CheY-like chemotaxis protein